MKKPGTAHSHPAWIGYPSQAAFGRPLPKTKIYEHSKVNTQLKDLFVKEVEQIVWQYKLAPETVNLPARPPVQEIQVFSLKLKTSELNLAVLRAIDGAVPFPILFELNFESRAQVVACYKRPSQVDASRWVTSAYFSSPWLPCDTPRVPLPLALDLASLYEQLLHRLVPVAPRPQEPMDALIERLERVAALQREVERTRTRMGREKQFNRKVEINATLRSLNTELEQLRR